MCRDFSLNQPECPMNLMRQYYSVGDLERVTKQLIEVLRMERKDRVMLNYVRLYECDLPYYVLEAYSYNANPQVNTKYKFFIDKDHARYMIMVVCI